MKYPFAVMLRKVTRPLDLRLLRPLILAFGVTALGGCLVSFDGYSLDEEAGSGNPGGAGNAAGNGGGAAGKAGASGTGGGAAGLAGAGGGSAGVSGSAGQATGGAGSSQGGAGSGAAGAGQAGDGGAQGGAGGTVQGGEGGAGQAGGGASGEGGSAGQAGGGGAGQAGDGGTGQAGDGGSGQVGGAGQAGDGGAGQAGDGGAGQAGDGGAGQAGDGGAGQAGAGQAGGGSGQAGDGGAGQAGAGQAGAGQAGAGAGGSGQAGASGAGAGQAGASAGGAGQGGAGQGGAGQGGAGQGGAGQAGEAGQAGSGGAPFECPVGLAGPQLLKVPAPDGSFYCIDRTEVTSAHYKEFLDAGVSVSGQPSYCSANTKYDPEKIGGCGGSGTFPYDPVNFPDKPVVCVDWCDAYAYCAWAGKRLCGQIGGGSNPPGNHASASESQWYNACSKGGTREFPYGDVYKGAFCNGIDSSFSGVIDVTFHANCVGGYSGLFDMSGNAAEWEDSCESATGGSDKCAVRGGDYLTSDSGASTLRCDSSDAGVTNAKPFEKMRSERGKGIGFRCCSP